MSVLSGMALGLLAQNFSRLGVVIDHVIPIPEMFHMG